MQIAGDPVAFRLLRLADQPGQPAQCFFGLLAAGNVAGHDDQPLRPARFVKNPVAHRLEQAPFIAGVLDPQLGSAPLLARQRLLPGLPERFPVLRMDQRERIGARQFFRHVT